jgi:hypothetical protein
MRAGRVSLRVSLLLTLVGGLRMGAIALVCAGALGAEQSVAQGAIAQSVDARKAEADRLLQQGIQQYQVSQGLEVVMRNWLLVGTIALWSVRALPRHQRTTGYKSVNFLNL